MPGVAWLFPGQGSQVVGMGKALADRSPAAAAAFAEASDALSLDIAALCWDGPQAELDRTANAQPAILTTSIAALRAALDAGARADDPLCLGHSLGEFSALVAAGALALADAVRLVRLRGELMQAADASGGMAAVIGLDSDAIERVLSGSDAVVANDNAPGQVVISGPLAALDALAPRLREAGAKRVVPLRVSGAFHSPSMRAVAPALREALDSARWSPLRYRVISNVDADVHEHARDFPELLERQVSSPVRWVASMRRAHGEGASLFVEFGAGNVLSGLAKRIVPDVRTANVSDPTTLEEALHLVR